VIIFLCLLGIAGAWAWREAEAGLAQIDAELSAAVGQELWAIQEGRSELAATLATGSREELFWSRLKRDYDLLVDAAASTSTAGGILANMEMLQLRDDQAVVRVLIGIGDEKYRQTRFYRRTSEGWSQMPPQPALLGEWRVLQTEYLSIGHFDLDAQSVAEAAPRLDAYVAQTRADFGLPQALEKVKYEIEIVYDRNSLERNLMTTIHLHSTTIQMTSPLPQLVPASVSESDTIVQLAALQLTYPMVQDALEQQDEKWRATAQRWLQFLSALRLWAYWESDAPLATWRHEIVEMGLKAYTFPDEIPTHYDDVCHAYRVWNLSPWSMSIPLICEAPAHEPYLTSALPATLHGLLTPGIDCCDPEWDARSYGYRIGLTTVLDYTLAVYGRERLPVLVGALSEHDSWESLIPAVFGISAAEFETGWQAYLAEEYGDDTQ
jgi:hypothetical protein